jgi:glycosyltransferase A (GT-A) superfamily protein (DUF2064 family)
MLRSLEDVAVEWWVEGDPLHVPELAGSRWPLFRQADGELGRRLGAAFERAFAAGGGPVAAIGTDCPLLARCHLQELFRCVERGADACLIPAEDGGYVALALAKPCPEAFSRIPWSTASVLDATVAALRGAGRVVERLSALYDVDELPDVERLARDLALAPARAPKTAELLHSMCRVPGSGFPVEKQKHSNTA